MVAMQIYNAFPRLNTIPVAGRRRRDAAWGRLGTVARVAVVLLPTLLAGVYFGLLATDRYVSEARFVIRAPKPTSILGGLDALLQIAGLSHTQDDAYAVRDFLTSRDAVRELATRVDLPAIYRHMGTDPLVRYPSLLWHATDEGFYRYFQTRLSVIVNNTTGLTTMRVEAFRPDDAAMVAKAMLGLGEDLINKLNTRMQEDALRVATTEVARAEQRRVDSQLALTDFRTRELILDPGKTSAIIVTLIGQLSAQLAETRTQIAETEATSRNSPQLGNLRERANALQQQIVIERGRVANSSDGLAEKIAEYERLVLQQEFSIRALAQAVAAMEIARVDARRQQMFLERVVEPAVADEATMPRRWQSVLIVCGFNVIGGGVLWLLLAGLREHAGMSARRR